MTGQRLNPFEHALKRPDTYIGSIKTVEKECYVLEIPTTDGLKPSISTRKAKWNSGMFNIIREIGSNCIDNKWRSQGDPIFEMKGIKVAYQSDTKELSFWNDGKCIPVEKKSYDYKDHRSGKVIKEEFYPAEIFFGEMLAGTNFDDNEERKTSGRNGMGSKCSNIFSKRFTIEHVDSSNKKKFIQTYTDNAKNRTNPKVTSSSVKGYTKILFEIDFERFGYDISKDVYYKDFIGLLGMYILEVAAMTALPVSFTIDGKTTKFHFKTFDKYVRMFYPEVSSHKVEMLKLYNGDECVIVESHTDARLEIPDMLENVRHMSFVNGLRTKDGGVHVDAWRDAICQLFVRQFNAKKRKVPLKTSAKEIYPYLTMFIRTEVSNPSFDTQTKNCLNGPVYKILPECKTQKDKNNIEKIKSDLDKVVKKMMKWNFIKLLEEKLISKTDRVKVKKTVKKRVDMGDKAQDANKAGKYPSNTKCTLYITEGLSAKAMVVRGISTLKNGQDYNGAFAVQGKFINVLNASSTAVSNNEESNLLKEMLNLRLNCDYSKDENWNSLRYHKVCITTDMDDDGIHIRGLLINFFYTLWPSLLDRNFVISLSTAVAKVSFPNKKQPKLFYSNPEYKEWYEQTGNKMKIAEVKYLKGLGSIHPSDVPGYFSEPKVVSYYQEGDEAEYMDLGFNDKYSDLRKEWLIQDADSTEEEPEFVYNDRLGISTFVDTQLIIYHKMTLRRALPNFMDGFKESQRKAFYAIRLKNYKNTKDLEKVSGAVKEITGYHHGAASLLNCIKNMAIRYPGSNNIPLLQDDGEFGTRACNGRDSAAARYISTALESISKYIFKDVDDNILENIIEDNEKAEYKFFVPVICMLLINGADGIASGFSTSIPNYNPLDILTWTRAWIDGNHKSMPRLTPWYRGIKGEIKLVYDKNGHPEKWKTKGILEEDKNGWWDIKDLPVGKWTNSFKDELVYLETGESASKKKDKNWTRSISDFNNYSTANFVHFKIKPVDGWRPSINTTLKSLQTTKSLGNMRAIDENNFPTLYKSAEDIIEEWCKHRLYYYNKRREYIINSLKFDILKASNKYNYVKSVIDKKLNMYQEDDKLEESMVNLGLTKMGGSYRNKENVSFEYLLGMQMRSMSKKKLEELKCELDTHEAKLKAMESKSDKDLWKEDLNEFETAYKKYINSRELQ